MAKRLRERRRQRREARQKARYYFTSAIDQLREEGKLDESSKREDIVSLGQERALKLAAADGADRPVLDALKAAFIELLPVLIEIAKTLLMGWVGGMLMVDDEDDDE